MLKSIENASQKRNSGNIFLTNKNFNWWLKGKGTSISLWNWLAEQIRARRHSLNEWNRNQAYEWITEKLHDSGFCAVNNSLNFIATCGFNFKW